MALVERVRDECVALAAAIGKDREWSGELYEAALKLGSDRPSGPVDALFFFGRSYMDASRDGLFALAVDLYEKGMVGCIIIPGTEGERFGSDKPGEANPGKTAWKDRLVRMGIPEEAVIFSDPGYHTKAEGDAFLTEAIRRNWKSAIYIANPHQVVRAGLGLVKTINKDGRLSAFRAYAAVPTSVNWQKKVMGSQGLDLKPRDEHIADETNRIRRYQTKKDLATFGELFDYLNRRDNWV
jgi:hypothetical protein